MVGGNVTGAAVTSAEQVATLTTVVVAAADVHPFTVAVTAYVPAMAAVTLLNTGFCAVDVNPFGPVQLYVAPAIVLAVRLTVPPAYTGPLFVAVGVAGSGVTLTDTPAEVALQPFASVTVTL